MIAKIATGVFAFAAMSVMFAGTAQAQVLPDGNYEFTNGDAAGRLVVILKKVGMAGEDGIYEVATTIPNTGKYLFAASSDEGDVINPGGPQGTLWILHNNGGPAGWSFLHSKNGANALSHSGGGKLKLRRNNADGQGNSDQLWKMKKL